MSRHYTLPTETRWSILRLTRDLFGEWPDCPYCDAPFWWSSGEVDHIVSDFGGGTNAPHNLIVSCAPCNRSKSSKILAAWLKQTDRHPRANLMVRQRVDAMVARKGIPFERLLQFTDIEQANTSKNTGVKPKLHDRPKQRPKHKPPPTVAKPPPTVAKVSDRAGWFQALDQECANDMTELPQEVTSTDTPHRLHGC